MTRRTVPTTCRRSREPPPTATSRAPSASQGPQQEAAPRRRDCLASRLGPSGHTEAPVLLPNARFLLIFQGKAQPRDRTLGAGQRGEGGDAYGGLTSAASQPFPHDTGLRSRRRSQSPLFLCALPAWGRRRPVRSGPVASGTRWTRALRRFSSLSSSFRQRLCPLKPHALRGPHARQWP